MMELDKKLEEGEDPVVLAILVTSTATLVVASVYWILLLRSTSCQLLVLPHLLLLSIFLGSSSSLALVLIESSSTCLVFVLQPISYSLVYSSILLRLISLHLHQRKLPASSLQQVLLFFLSILLQLSPTFHQFLTDGCRPKSSSPGGQLLHFSYCLVCLLLCLAVLPLLRAATEVYLTFATLLLSSLSWVGWVSAAIVFPDQLDHLKQLGLQASLMSAMLVLPFPSERPQSLIIQTPGYLFVTYN